MAHVLLPCDLPTWSDVQRHLAQLKTCKNGEQVTQIMLKIYETCCISLDPDDNQPKSEHSGFQELRFFIDDIMTEQERSKFLTETLSTMVSQALNLRIAKPPNGFLYSLKKEDSTFVLERPFIASLLANAFFSTFPKRNSKTHPTLQDFSFADFFTYLTKRSHQKKLKVLLRYFEKLDMQPKGMVTFVRKVVHGPSLPGWLCSDRPLVPLIVRPEGTLHEAEPHVFRAFPCTSLIGGDVLKTSTSQEAKLFFTFPELLVSLSFVESLGDDESLLTEGIYPATSARKSSRQGFQADGPFCFLDSLDFSGQPNRQFEDRCLLRELNKALAAFSHEPRDLPPSIHQRRQTPVGESSSSGPSRRASSNVDSETRSSKRLVAEDVRKRAREKKDKCQDEPRSADETILEDKKSSYFPVIATKATEEAASSQTHRSSTSSCLESKVSEWPSLPIQQPPSRVSMAVVKASSQSSSKLSMKTASQSSVELPPIQPPLREEEYYTADEDNGEEASVCGLSKSCLRGIVLHREKRCSVAMTDLLKEEQLNSCRKSFNSRDASSDVSRSLRSESVGFVLGGDSEEENEFYRPNQHERLEDFRKRIRKRTRRRLSRRSSRSSYSGSSGSSDMEDISEDPELPVPQTRIIRPASSEPSIITALDEAATTPLDFPLLSPAAETALITLGGKKMMVTSSNGHLKAYSYDGVNPNLPVPFKAKFRRRRHHSEEGDKSFDKDLLWSASMMERCSSTEDLSSCSGFKNEESSILDGDKDDPKKTSPSRWPVAAAPWTCCGDEGDSQLKSIILWLAASMAELPALILYTLQEPALDDIISVYGKVLNRKWTVGDLSCEVLRFCRNRISPKRRIGLPPQLFRQLIGSEAVAASSLSYNLSQQSLD